MTPAGVQMLLVFPKPQKTSKPNTTPLTDRVACQPTSKTGTSSQQLSDQQDFFNPDANTAVLGGKTENPVKPFRRPTWPEMAAMALADESRPAVAEDCGITNPDYDDGPPIDGGIPF